LGQVDAGRRVRHWFCSEATRREARIYGFCVARMVYGRQNSNADHAFINWNSDFVNEK
jgi:hypothetical protein